MINTAIFENAYDLKGQRVTRTVYRKTRLSNW